MNFSELIVDIDFLCGTTSASYPIADKTRNINNEYQRIAVLIDQISDSWQFDDNNTTAASASRKSYITMGNASASYEMPTTIFRIDGAEVKNNNGDWIKLKPLDPVKDLTISRDEYLTTPGVPVYYDLEGKYINLYPSPASADVTLTNGLLVRASKEVTEFPTTATTTEPGFVSPFHRILSLAASIDFVDDSSVKNRLVSMRDRLERGIINFYSHRNSELPTKIMPNGKRFWRQYL